MLYRVYKIQSLVTTYKVEAVSEDEAERLVAEGSVDGKVQEDDYNNEIKYEVEPV